MSDAAAREARFVLRDEVVCDGYHPFIVAKA
jgi:hypothetical protein